MDEQQFQTALKEKGIELTSKQLAQFATYYELLVNWNKKMDLTTITEKKEVYLKHFYDSITLAFYTNLTDEKVCDIGAGAGFPSIPLKICFPNLKITIVDSLKKRITFLEELVQQLNLKDVTLIHERAENVGQNKKYRESFDIVTARAVARLSVLSELCLPLCKRNGLFLAMKGAKANEELIDAEKALQTLGGKVKQQETFALPKDEASRSIIIIQKNKFTPKKYPRQAGTPNRNPIGGR